MSLFCRPWAAGRTVRARSSRRHVRLERARRVSSTVCSSLKNRTMHWFYGVTKAALNKSRGGEHFALQEVGARVGAVIMATLFGVALGGWLSG